MGYALAKKKKVYIINTCNWPLNIMLEFGSILPILKSTEEFLKDER
jgi:hypothetical protein